MKKNRIKDFLSSRPSKVPATSTSTLLTIEESFALGEAFDYDPAGGDSDMAKVRKIMDWASNTRGRSIVVEAALAGRISIGFKESGNLSFGLVARDAVSNSLSPKLAIDYFPPLSAEELDEFNSFKKRLDQPGGTSPDSLTGAELSRFASLGDRIKVRAMFTNGDEHVDFRQGKGKKRGVTSLSPSGIAEPSGARLLSQGEQLVLCRALGRSFTKDEAQFLWDWAIDTRVRQMFLDATLQKRFTIRFRESGELAFAPVLLQAGPPQDVTGQNLTTHNPEESTLRFWRTLALQDFPPLTDLEREEYNLLTRRSSTPGDQGADSLTIQEMSRHIELDDRAKVQSMML